MTTVLEYEAIDISPTINDKQKLHKKMHICSKGEQKRAILILERCWNTSLEVVRKLERNASHSEPVIKQIMALEMTAHIENNWLATLNQLGKMVRVYYICCPRPEDINTCPFLTGSDTLLCCVQSMQTPWSLDLMCYRDIMICALYLLPSLGPYMHLGAAG